jgi:aspartyl-tRNA(Asn)/glutamyl-tRNA(Gln) amidotransferase subunit C
MVSASWNELPHPEMHTFAAEDVLENRAIITDIFKEFKVWTYKMSLNSSDVKRIAHLARIEVTDSEAEAVLQKLSGILNLIEQMQAVDTTGITPMSHSQDVTQRLRQDKVTETNQRDSFQAIAPQLGNGSTEPAVADGLYLVPQVIE